MRKCLLGLYFATMLLSNVARASGAGTILFNISPNSYIMTSAAEDPDFGYSYLSNVFNQASNKLFIARIDHEVYTSAAYLSSKGVNVVVGFDDFKDVRFKYVPAIKNFVAVTPQEEVILLLEKVRSSDGDGIDEERDDCQSAEKHKEHKH